MSDNIVKNYFAGESPDSAPNYFEQPNNLVNELCELCMRFGALHEAIDIMEALLKTNAGPAILAPMERHIMRLSFSVSDLLDKFIQHGGSDAQVEDFRKTLRAEHERMQQNG